jgi:hypothetical protein
VKIHAPPGLKNENKNKICPPQPKSEFLKIHFTISRPQKKKFQSGGKAASAAACAIGAFIGLHG